MRKTYTQNKNELGKIKLGKTSLHDNTILNLQIKPFKQRYAKYTSREKIIQTFMVK